MNLGVGLGVTSSNRTVPVTLSPTLVALMAHTAVLAVYEPSRLSTMGQGLGNTSTRPVANGPVGYVANRKAGGYNLSAGEDVRRPLATNGLTFDASNDRLGFATSVGAMPASATIIFLIKNVTTTAFFLVADGSNVGAAGQGGIFADGAGTVGGSVLVDGVAKATRDDIFTAACDGAYHVIEHVGGNFSAWANLYFNGYSGLNFAGVLVPVAILDTAATGYAAALTTARTWAGELRALLAL